MLKRRLLAMIFIFVIIGLVNADPEIDPLVVSYEELMSKSEEFTDGSVKHYEELLFDGTRDQVLVGARDTLYRLSLDKLENLEKATWPSQLETVQSCIEKGQSEEDCHNYVKVLFSNGQKLFACGTNAFSPICTWREMENVSKITDTMNGIAKCPYSPHSNVTALMTTSGQYFAGTPLDFSGSDSVIIKDKDNKNSFIRTVQYDSKWLNNPEFVGSFETDSFVYFFFREVAVEYINCGKRIYSRVARVCKNDSGGTYRLRNNWTTFLKARLNCSLSGEYPFYFDEIQHITYLADEGLVYATFQTPRNGIAGSGICSFNLTAINSAFNGPYKYQETLNSSWEPHVSSIQNQSSCQSPNTQSIIEASKYQLMDNAVQPITKDPIYQTSNERLIHIAVDVLATKVYRPMHVIFVTTEENIIKKLTVLPRTQKACIVEIWKPYPKSPYTILAFHFVKQMNSLYVGSKTNVLRIPVHQCERHKNHQSCTNAMDAYCGWDELKEKCTLPPDNNPLSSYWQQSVISCPSFDYPVVGGWSVWSDWEPCTHSTSAGASTSDRCLCSMRQCNNPTPQNGGAYCDGISIQVTNCTVHGGWTPWSAWSACSETCGLAVKTRSRTCSNPSPAFGGRVCVGQPTEEAYCQSNPPCPEKLSPARNGGWSSWGTWSECSTKCGGGYRVRSRKCDNPPPQRPNGLECQGCNLDYELCNTSPCTESRKLSSWTPWLLTENKTEKRFRFSCMAPVGDPKMIKIVKSNEDERICQENGLCHKPSHVNSEESWPADWTPWSPCSVECGGGTQSRTKICDENMDNCQDNQKMTRMCNTHSCKGEWGCWTDWSSCTGPCGAGIRTRSRKCLSLSNRHMEASECEGPSTMQEQCEVHSCIDEGWSEWSPWSNCDEFNQQSRTRRCLHLDSQSLCVGPKVEERSCDETNEIGAYGVQSKHSSDPPSTFAVFAFSIFAFIGGCIISGLVSYYWMKKHRKGLPASPHYISKQNPYVTVPLKDVRLPKRSSSFKQSSSPSPLVNGTPKLFINKPLGEYETATIKRNSHSMLNGHARTPTLEEEKFF